MNRGCHGCPRVREQVDMANKMLKVLCKEVTRHPTNRVCHSLAAYRSSIEHRLPEIHYRKINIGGTEFPVTFTAQHNVIKVPRSAEVTFPTCLTPRPAITFPGWWTVVTPVSSTLYTW